MSERIENLLSPEKIETFEGEIDSLRKIIKQANTHYKENYMISPLSIAYALSILREGSTGNTKTELDNLLGDYKLLDFKLSSKT